MAAIDFPSNPTVNDEFTVAGRTWIWDGATWNSEPFAEKQNVVPGVSDTEIGYLDGVTSAIQTQLNGKLSATVSSPTSGQVISYNGSGWVNAAAPASGGMTLIADTTLSSGQNTVTLSSIPQTYKKLELEINFTGGVNGPSTATMVFNGQTSSSYGWGAANYGVSSGNSTATASFVYGINQAAGVILPGITAGSTSVTIPNYTSSVHYKNFQFFNFLNYITSSAYFGSGIWNSYLHSNNPITSIGFTFSNVGGSTVYRIKLWGVN